jgi:hypothetical protein
MKTKTALIVRELRSKVALSFSSPVAPDRLAELKGFFEFTPTGNLTCWMPDLLGAFHLPSGTVRVSMSGAAVYHEVVNGEFVERK